jgi:hypothetical protein
MVLSKERRRCPLSVFFGRLIKEVLPSWGYDPIKKEKRRLCDLIDTVVLLRSGGVHEVVVIEAYHTRGVVPLMVRALLLYGMMLDVPPEGTLLAQGPLRNSEIEQRIREHVGCAQ